MPKFGPDEPWKKVFGPVFIYVNSVFGDGDPFWLWEDAKEQVQHKKQTDFFCIIQQSCNFFVVSWIFID